MATSTYLVTVSGADRIGVGAELFAALASLHDSGVEITDVAQITIRGALVLCAEVSCEGAFDAERITAALQDRDIEGRGISVHVEAVAASEVADGRRLLVTFLAPNIHASQLEAVFASIASRGAPCARIVHLARYPVPC